MKDKKTARMRRRVRTRARIATAEAPRLCVHRTPRHMYAQVIASGGGEVLACASTVEREVRDQLAYGGNKAAAEVIGRLIAERARTRGVTRVAFDRSGFKFHGRVRSLAEAARANGLEF